jgi:hypothetical protein
MLAKTLFLLCVLFLVVHVPVSADDSFFYQKGQTNFDYQPCWMRFDINGDSVTNGILEKEGVCETNVRLSKTEIKFSGTVVNGPWEGDNGTAAIEGSWTGVDTVCGNPLTGTDEYPQSGSFTIYQENGRIIFKRSKTSPLPSDYQYIFHPTGTTGENQAGDGHEQDIAPAGQVTKSITLLFDASGSMGDDNKIDHAKTAAKQAIMNLNDSTEVALIVFSDCNKIEAVQPFTSDKNLLTEKIDQIVPGGSTPLADAIDFANEYKINAHSTKRSIVLFTDGIETCR